MAIQEFQNTIINDFSPGFQTKRDPSDLPPGAAADGQNIVISDGDKIKPVEGWTLFGAADATAVPVTSAFTFQLSTGLEIPQRASGTVMEYYSELTSAWENLNDGYTSGKRFGFAHFYDSTEFKDYSYFGNGVESYSRWSGAYDILDGALAGGETEVTTDTVLQTRVHYSGTAASVTTTSLTITASDWATDIYNDEFYVHITSGAQSGKISKITDTTATVLTFGTITGLSGTPTFEVRQAKFAHSGTVRIGTTDVTYTSLDQENRFAGCSSVPVASDNAAIAQAVTTYPANPKGNIFYSLDERMYLCHEDEAVVNVSAVSDATDFTFSGPRSAGEGDLGLIPDGGGAIKGLGTEEETLVVVKRNILKTLAYSRDTNDVIQLKTLIEADSVGTISPKCVFRVDNSLYYASPQGGVKAVSRVPEIDFVQSIQLADPIRKTTDLAVFDAETAGIFFDEKAYISAKQTSASSVNDIIFVFNFQKNAWELPIIGLNASAFFLYKNKLYATSSLNNEAYQMLNGEFVIKSGTTEFPMKAKWTSGLTSYGLPANRKGFNMYYVEGYITAGTTITVTIDFEFEGVFRSVSGTIKGTDTAILLDTAAGGPLGVEPLGVDPLGAGAEASSELKKFRVYLTTNEVPFYEHQITFESDGIGQNWEILRYGPNALSLRQIDPGIKKALN